MRRVIFLTIISLSLSAAGFAQGKEDARCPRISVDGPAGIIPPGNIAEFLGTVTGDVPPNVTYLWTVSDGDIVSGRNDLRLNVRILKDGGNVTATFNIDGLPRECPTNVSATYSYVVDPGPIPIEEYSLMSLKKEYERLKLAAIKLRNYPNSVLFVIRYPTPTVNFRKRNVLIKRYAENVLGLADGLTIVEGREQERERTKIFIVRPGVSDPTP